MNHALNYIQRNLFNAKILFMCQKNNKKTPHTMLPLILVRIHLNRRFFFSSSSVKSEGKILTKIFSFQQGHLLNLLFLFFISSVGTQKKREKNKQRRNKQRCKTRVQSKL